MRTLSLTVLFILLITQDVFADRKARFADVEVPEEVVKQLKLLGADFGKFEYSNEESDIGSVVFTFAFMKPPPRGLPCLVLGLSGETLARPLTKMAELGKPFGVWLSGSEPTDADLKVLAALDGLTVLHMYGCKNVTVDGLKELAKAKGLRELVVDQSKLGDQACEVLAGFDKLEALRLTSSDVTAQGVKALAGMKALESIDLARNPRLGNAGMKELAGCKTLRCVSVMATYLTKQGIVELATLPKLESLHIGYNDLSDSALAPLAKAAKLQSLNVTGCRSISFPAAKHLKDLKEFRHFNFKDTFMRFEVEQIEKILPKCKLQYDKIPGK